MGVFDGHGGWQVSHLLMNKLHLYIDENLKGAKSDKDIISAINKGFDKAEKEWYDFTKTAFEKGYPRAAYVGSCVLVAVVHNNKLYVANSGDSKGVLLKKKQDGSYERIKLSKTFNANKSYEQQRLKQLFPKEEDIIICKEHKACYVKGNLMPSRAIGDLRLKHAEFNTHSMSFDYGYRKMIPVYNGPYIEYRPDIQVFELTANDQWIVLATDGLWDEIQRKQAAVLSQGNDQDMKQIAEKLFDAALDHVSKEKSKFIK